MAGWDSAFQQSQGRCWTAVPSLPNPAPHALLVRKRVARVGVPGARVGVGLGLPVKGLLHACSWPYLLQPLSLALH